MVYYSIVQALSKSGLQQNKYAQTYCQEAAEQKVWTYADTDLFKNHLEQTIKLTRNSHFP